MSPLKLKRNYLAQQNRLFGSSLVEIPRKDWPKSYINQERSPTRVWRSRDFLVQFRVEPECAGRLSINRTAIKSDGDWKDGITWDEINRLKSEAGFGSSWAVEVLPPDEDLVNVANIRHVWLLKEKPSFAWTKENT